MPFLIPLCLMFIFKNWIPFFLASLSQASVPLHQNSHLQNKGLFVSVTVRICPSRVVLPILESYDDQCLVEDKERETLVGSQNVKWSKSIQSALRIQMYQGRVKSTFPERSWQWTGRTNRQFAIVVSWDHIDVRNTHGHWTVKLNYRPCALGQSSRLRGLTFWMLWMQGNLPFG